MMRHDSPILERETHIERALSQRERPTISLASAFSTGDYTAKSSEVVFFAGEDLFRDSMVGTRELAIRKHCKCKFDLDDERTFESYCFEFCGLLNLHYSEIKFMIGSKDIVMARTVRKACQILVFYNTLQKKVGSSGITSDFGLRSAYSQLFETGVYSDIEIVVNGEKLSAHKCILAARSEKFKVMLTSEATEQMLE